MRSTSLILISTLLYAGSAGADPLGGANLGGSLAGGASASGTGTSASMSGSLGAQAGVSGNFGSANVLGSAMSDLYLGSSHDLRLRSHGGLRSQGNVQAQSASATGLVSSISVPPQPGVIVQAGSQAGADARGDIDGSVRFIQEESVHATGPALAAGATAQGEAQSAVQAQVQSATQTRSSVQAQTQSAAQAQAQSVAQATPSVPTTARADSSVSANGGAAVQTSGTSTSVSGQHTTASAVNVRN